MGLGPQGAQREWWDPLSSSQDPGAAGLGLCGGAADVLILMQVGHTVPMQPGEQQALHGTC